MWPRCSARRAHHACACGQECDHLLLNSSTGPCCSCSSSRMLADPARAPANHLVEVMTLRERAGRRSEWHARAWRLKPRCRRERAARARRVRGRSARQESAPLDSVQTSTSKRLERLSGSRNTDRSSAPPSLQRAPTARAPRKSKSAFCYSWIYSWPACAPAGQK